MNAMQFIAGVVALACALSVVMSLAWMTEQATGNSGWVDTFWTFGLGAIGVAAALLPQPLTTTISARQCLVAAAIAVWSLRLGVHIAARTRRRPDDPRYAKLRNDWGTQACWQMWLLCQKQAVVSVPMATAVWLAAHHPAAGLRVQDVIGMLIVATSICGESASDRQLRQFGRQPENNGKICDIGLWRWSRHPNYFFEWFGWLAYPAIAVDFTGEYAVGWFALAGPACMYWLLVYVSGIPPLEEHMLKTRPAGFRDYQSRTNAFFPWPRKQHWRREAA